MTSDATNDDSLDHGPVGQATLPVPGSEIVDLIDVQQQQAAAIVAAGQLRLNAAIHLWLLAVSAVVIGLSFLLSTRGSDQVLIPVFDVPLPELCYARRALKMDCPGCGLTRSFISISHGQLSQAWFFNPTGFLLYGLVAFQIPFRLIQLWRLKFTQRPLGIPHFEYFFWALAAIMAVQWAARLVNNTLF